MQTPQVSLALAREAAYAAMLHGSREAPYHGDCEQPRIVNLRGVSPLLTKRLDALVTDPFIDWVDGRFLPKQAIHRLDMIPDFMPIDIKVRCRKCAACLRQRARKWTARAFIECGQAYRTWFGTLTLGPDRRFWVRASAISQVGNLNHLTPDERYKALERQIAPEVTRWLKRVRKASGATLRYFVTSESHKDGFPHYHILVHERCHSGVTKAQLDTAWKWGFTKFRLVDNHGKAAWYVSKYLSKDALTRVRASRLYGQGRSPRITEQRDASEARKPPACLVGKAKL